MIQLAITARNNKNLFSNYYLDNQIKNNREWKKEEHKAAFSEIKKLFDAEKDHIPTLNEKQLEQRFFGPIFKILNHTVEVNEGTVQGEFPDYAFFPDRASLDDAHKKMGNSFYNNAIAIGEVKRWGIELDRFGKDEKDRKRNPSLQIWIYLHDVSPKWGILSNGKIWRLYCKDRRRDDYYEIDLPSLLAKDESKNVEEFKYFYYFFRREAFLTSTDGKIFLDEVLKGSADYAKDIGDDLKDNVYKAMKKVAEGFLSWSQNSLDIQNEAARETVQKCTMLLLYRFLFLLYAEGKGLLDLKKPQYQSYSFYKLKNEVKEKHDGPLEQRYLGVGTTLWSHLKDTFRLINQGSESFGIDKNVLNVPAYNGGLFDPQKNPELEKWVIGDTYLSEAIDLLSRSRADGGKLDFVDYSTLEIRHLGSIYEGLLEYKLRVAEDEMVVNGGEWVKLEEYNKDRKQKKVFSDFGEFDRVRKGQIYLVTDKGERKATGSYYTPDYIVNYIVKNTIGPVVDEKWKEAEANKKSFVDVTLSVKVLDPAMGSGHFLVGSIEFLSEKLLLAVKKDIDNGRFSDESHLTSDWARREVVAHCIYGVDLNLMAVELAKVGLWLTTISKEKPLSFLDHRLKQGNSLIGARLSDIKYYPGAKKKDKDQTTLPSFISPLFITHLIGKIAELEKIKDERLEDIKRKEKVFEEFKQLPEYRKAKALANVYTGVYFGNEVTPSQNKDSSNVYYDLFWAIMGDENEWRRKTNRDWFIKANQIASDKSFFHWELEFPEIFFEGGAPKENPGWDAVVGNPPYFTLTLGKKQEIADENELQFYEKMFSETFEYKINTFCLFTHKALNLTAENGYFSYIIPNTFLSNFYMKNLRKYILDNYSLKEILDMKYKVFDEAETGGNTIPIVFKRHEANMTSISVISSKKEFTNGTFDKKIVSQNIFNEMPDLKFLTDLNIIKMLSKTKENSDLIGDITRIYQGIITGDNNRFISNRKENENYKKIVRGENVSRYGLTFTDQYVLFNKEELWSNTDEKMFDVEHKIISRQTSDHLVANIDTDRFFSLDSTHVIHPKINIYYFLSIFNSKLINFIYQQIVPEVGKAFAQVKTVNLKKLPIRRISFTTPPDRRAALVEQAKALYSDFLGAPGSEDLDRINRMDRIDTAANPVNPVQTVASLSAAPDSLKILEFIGARLSAAPEESDVVHDLLAYLAEWMIERNKEKNAEIKSFLDFLKGEIGVSVEDLSNKTAIREYYSHEFQNLIDVLVKNKNKLKAGYDPKSPSNYKHLQQWYNDSTGKLKPLMGRIEATDGLIDQIVYKLYGLTEDEIKIVEGSSNMNVKVEVKAS